MPNKYALALAALKSALDLALPLAATIKNGFTSDQDATNAKNNYDTAEAAAPWKIDLMEISHS